MAQNKPDLKVPLKDTYHRLYKAFGPQHWWPGETPFEVIVGAILTQNTNWQNVEKAIDNLKRENCLNPSGLKRISTKKLARLIRPSGYFNIKAHRLKKFIEFLYNEYHGRIDRMAKRNLITLRKELLAVNGIGLETCDSILLYALNKPVFVVDAYTKRILTRHNILANHSTYHQIQELFMKNLPRNIRLFNEYHALLVKVGKEFCKKAPDCNRCPLKEAVWN